MEKNFRETEEYKELKRLGLADTLHTILGSPSHVGYVPKKESKYFIVFLAFFYYSRKIFGVFPRKTYVHWYSSFAILFAEGRPLKVKEIKRILDTEFFMINNKFDIVTLSDLDYRQRTYAKLAIFISNLKRSKILVISDEADPDERILKFNSQFKGGFLTFYTIRWPRVNRSKK